MVVGGLAACLLIRMLNWFDSAQVSKSAWIKFFSFMHPAIKFWVYGACFVPESAFESPN